MDTRRLEQIGETLITSALLETGILPAKPFFDHLGADLIGFTSIDDRGRFCRIQCKYRTLKKTASITVDSSYVVGAFILFVCLHMAGKKSLYCFTANEIRKVFRPSVVRAHSVFRLVISKTSTSALSKYDYGEHPQERNAAVFDLVKQASPVSELRRVFSGLRSTMQKLSEVQRRRDDLRELVHKAEMAELKKTACDAQIAILKEYAGVLECQLKAKQRQKRKGSNHAAQATAPNVADPGR